MVRLKINIQGGNKPWSQPESFLVSLFATFISDTCKELHTIA